MKYIKDPMVMVLSAIACLCAVGLSYGTEFNSKASDLAYSLQKETVREKEEIQVAQCGVTYAAPSCGVTYSPPPVTYSSCAVSAYSTDCGGGVTYGTVAPPTMRAYVIPRTTVSISRIPGPPRNVNFKAPGYVGR